MCWAKVERLQSNAQATLRKKCAADTTFPEKTKIGSLPCKMNDPELKCLAPTVIQRVKDKPTCAFLQAMSDIKEDVVRRRPVSNNNKCSRQVKEANAKKHQNNKFEKAKGQNCHPQAKTITLKSGKKIKCHHSFKFDAEHCKLLTNTQTKLSVKSWRT